jgi:hypothetical protein
VLDFWISGFLTPKEQNMSKKPDLVPAGKSGLIPKRAGPVMRAAHPADRRFEAMLKGKLAQAKRQPGPPRIVISLDATSSMGEFLPDRKLDFEAYLGIAQPMFTKASGLLVRFVYFRGTECRVSRWFSNPMELARSMASVQSAPGWTQHNRVFERVIREAEEVPIQELVVISDAFEERGPHRPDGDVLEDARVQATQLRGLGVKVTVAYRGTITGGCPLDRAGPRAEECFRDIVKANEGSMFLLHPANLRHAVEHITQVVAHAELQAKGDAAGAKVLLEHMQAVPFSMDPVGEQVPNAKCNAGE